MRVAVIGAGFAGIVCAAQLERYGIVPDIYERNDKIAEPYRHMGLALEIALRPIKDPLRYLTDKYNISLKPSGLVKKAVHISPSACAAITGNLGYFLVRGADPDSIDNQLGKNLKASIHLNTDINYKDLQKEYDYVVVASGYPTEAKALGIWQDVLMMRVRGTVVTGDFADDTFIVWINKDYCKSGYAYLSPFNTKEASLILAVDEIEQEEMDIYWQRFIKAEKVEYKITESFDKVHYVGFVYPHRVDNIYFIGNAGGCLDPLLGFGVFPSVVTASEAAKSIAYGTDYDSSIKEVVTMNKKMLEFRKAFDKLDNRKYDLLINSLNLPGVNPLVYRWRKINVVNTAYSFLKPINSLLRLGENPMKR